MKRKTLRGVAAALALASLGLFGCSKKESEAEYFERRFEEEDAAVSAADIGTEDIIWQDGLTEQNSPLVGKKFKVVTRLIDNDWNERADYVFYICLEKDGVCMIGGDFGGDDRQYVDPAEAEPGRVSPFMSRDSDRKELKRMYDNKVRDNYGDDGSHITYVIDKKNRLLYLLGSNEPYFYDSFLKYKNVLLSKPEDGYWVSDNVPWDAAFRYVEGTGAHKGKIALKLVNFYSSDPKYTYSTRLYGTVAMPYGGTGYMLD